MKKYLTARQRAIVSIVMSTGLFVFVLFGLLGCVAKYAYELEQMSYSILTRIFTPCFIGASIGIVIGVFGGLLVTLISVIRNR